MMPAKKEDGDRDRLIEFLKLTEGVEYRTVDVNVLNRPREKNFDYLLQANSGATLALEITWLTDKDETAADEREHHDFVQDKEKFLKLRQILESSISRAYLPCSVSISVPFHAPCERKALNSLPADALVKAKVQLMTAIEGMSVGDSVSVTIDFDSFQTILNPPLFG